MLGFVWAVLGLELCLFCGIVFSIEFWADGPRLEEFWTGGLRFEIKRFVLHLIFLV